VPVAGARADELTHYDWNNREFWLHALADSLMGDGSYVGNVRWDGSTDAPALLPLPKRALVHTLGPTMHSSGSSVNGARGWSESSRRSIGPRSRCAGQQRIVGTP
jgi:hypothetical protein